MSLVGRSSSNYHTAQNHCFRNVSSYDAKSHTKRKCPMCGIWGKKGNQCMLCGGRIPGPSLNSLGVQLNVYSNSDLSCKQKSKRSLNSNNSSTQLVRKEKNSKITCSYCGIWVTPSTLCSLCRTQA